jgi:hypothetical protein
MQAGTPWVGCTAWATALPPAAAWAAASVLGQLQGPRCMARWAPQRWHPCGLAAARTLALRHTDRMPAGPLHPRCHRTDGSPVRHELQVTRHSEVCPTQLAQLLRLILRRTAGR